MAIGVEKSNSFLLSCHLNFLMSFSHSPLKAFPNCSYFGKIYIKPFSSMQFSGSTFTMLCNHHYHLKSFIIPNINSIPIKQ